MKFQSQLFAYRDLDRAIDRAPLIVNPDLLLLDAIALMQAVGEDISQPDLAQDTPAISSNGRSYDYALVMEGDELQGILTERDIVKLTAEQLSFGSVYVGDVMTESVITLAINSLNDIFGILFLLRRHRIRHLPIVDEANKLLGIITPTSIRNIIRPEYLLRMRRIGDVMTKAVFHASTTDTVLDVVRLMSYRRVSCIVITKTDENDNVIIPVGIITERDILQYQSLRLELDSLPAEAVMSAPLFLMNPEDSLFIANQEMERRHIRRLVVSWDDGKGLGIITQTNMLRVFDPVELYRTIEVLQDTLKDLEREKAELLKLVGD